MTAAERTDYLLTRYLARTISADEFDELMIWLSGLDASGAITLETPLLDLWNKTRDLPLSAAAREVNWEKIYAEVIAVPDRRILPLWKRLAVAAVFILLAGSAVYLYLRLRQEAPVMQLTSRQPIRDVAPGTTHAVLTLADGSHVLLDSVHNGQLATQGAVAITKLSNGQIAYKNVGTQSPSITPNVSLYNTLITHRGEQSPALTLSDGTRVWLNAASSIRFPVVFTGNNRSVTLNGEAYFEVAKNAQKPFVVTVGNTTVTVLGTHFNINAYPDEGSMKTTLLEGSVQVTEGTHSVLVQPGEQALEDDNGRLTAVPANTALAVAWRNGYFQFEEADLKAVLRQIGRWYDLDIVYEGPVTDHLYAGKLERSVPLSAILLFLSSGNIHYRLEGKRLVIE